MVNIKEYKEWQRLADMDLKTAVYLKKMKPLPVEIICYHCQQSAEKHLKGYLVLWEVVPPKMHDLDELCKLCIKYSDSFNIISDVCSDLTVYGVQPRYPMELVIDADNMKQAIDSAKKVMKFVTAMAKEIINIDKYQPKAEKTE